MKRQLTFMQLKPVKLSGWFIESVQICRQQRRFNIWLKRLIKSK